MKELKSFLERMGGLHDAVVRRINWVPEEKKLSFEIEDLCSNFEGLPEYPGAMPGTIELRDVDRVNFDIDTNEGHLNIDDFAVEIEGTDQYRASVTFWPTGRIAVWYRKADFPRINLKAETT